MTIDFTVGNESNMPLRSFQPRLEAMAQSMVGIAGAAFRWSLETATGVSTEDREELWKALMSYLQPCAHVDASPVAS